MNKIAQLQQTVEGFYGVGVVDSSGQLKRIRPFMDHNLILNSGMDGVYDRSWASSMEYAVAGVGTTPTHYVSSAQTVTQVADNVVLSSNSPISLETTAVVGDCIQFFGTLEGKILSFPVGSNGTRAVVDTTRTSLAPDTFTVWKTSQSSLASESKRAGLGIYNTYYVAGTEWCSTTDVDNQRRLRRTWDFAPETVLKRYTELGVSSSSSGTLFSRVLLDTPEDIDVGERLRMIYQLNVNLGPQSPAVQVANISGWYSTNGTECVQRPLTDSIYTTGTTAAGTAALEPYSQSDACSIFLSNNSSPVRTYGFADDRSATMVEQVPTTKSVQVPGTWYVDKTGQFKVHQMVSGSLRSMGLGVNNGSTRLSYDGTNQAFAFVFDDNQIKTNTQRLNLTFRFSWGRVLSTENITL